MAVGEAFLSAFLQVLFDRLASHEFIGLLIGRNYDDLIENFKITLLTVTALLSDAEEKQFHSPAVLKWLHMAKGAIYDAEDILDAIATEALKCQLSAEANSGKERDTAWNWRHVSSSLTPTGRGVEAKIRKIIERLELIAKYKNALGLKDHVGKRSFEMMKQRLETTSLVDESSVYGRDGDKEMVIKALLSDERKSDLGVVPIVGMGGIGKTTLAQLVFNDGRIDDHFEVRVWACVTEQFDVVRVTRTILSSLTLKHVDLDDLNLLQVCLRKEIYGKRILLVLDDVWNKRNSNWDLLWRPLRAAGKGSKIIVTTRNMDVASSMGTIPAHTLKYLSDEDCWRLFARETFENRDASVHLNLKGIGEKIVKKCAGLPLAVKRMGVLLCSRSDKDDWRDIKNRKIWDLPDEESEVLQSLSLSYLHLPPHLKQCFSFCAVLPEEHEFDKEWLVMIWMADGFLQQPKGKKRLEDVGDEYFSELVSRSIFERSIHDPLKFTMHRLFKELAEFVSGELCFQLEDKTSDGDQYRIYERARHSSYIRGNRDEVGRFEALNGVGYLRTFLPLDPMESIGVSYLANEVPHSLLPKLQYLRVLSFNACRLTELPNSIGKLKHLRYLDLSRTAINELPESTNTLYNLQTLKLSHCRNLTKLPSNLRNLKFLRYLCISGSRLREMPLQIHELKNLQSLSNFIVGKDVGANIKDLNRLSELRGSLHISGLQNVVSFVDAIEANMKEKGELDQLVLQWSNTADDSSTYKDEEKPYFPQHQDVSLRGFKSMRFPSFREAVSVERRNSRDLKSEKNKVSDDTRDERVEMMVLEMLQPHKNIKSVTIKDYGGPSFPSWIGSPLFLHIKFLKLKNCMKCENLPVLGQIPFLKKLNLDGMEKIKCIGVEFYGNGQQYDSPFPSLEMLKLKNMLNWEEWHTSGIEGRDDFNLLLSIEIRNCPKLQTFSHCFPLLKKMNISGCERLTALPRVSRFRDGIETSKEFPSLEELCIWACPNLMEMPNSFPSLTNLEIDGCQNLKNLPHLPLIRELELSSCHIESVQTVVRLKSLSYLRLCQITELTLFPDCFFENLTSLEELQIVDMSDLMTLSNRIGLHKIPSLQRMEISGCTVVEELPQTLHECSCLKELRIWQCPSLVSFPTTGLPSSLKVLEIKDCDALQALPSWKTKDTSLTLEYLIIEGCSSLLSLPEDELPNTLIEFEILDCVRLQSLPKHDVNNGSFLKVLRVTGCHSITRFPTDTSQHSILKNFIVSDCTNLKLLPDDLHSLGNLDHLEITDCPALSSFPETGLPFSVLRSIRLFNCVSLGSLPNGMHSLASLEWLCIESCPKISSIPAGGLPVNLLSLSILDCENLKPSFQWGLHKLTRLTELAFGGYRDLVSFPEDWLLPKSLSSLQLQRLPCITRLPSGLKDISSLDHLEIWECDRLKIDDGQPLFPHSFDFWNVL